MTSSITKLSSIPNLSPSQKEGGSVQRGRLVLSPLSESSHAASSAKRAVVPRGEVACALFGVATTSTSTGRLFNGMGRTKEEANFLVRSGNELYEQEEPAEALVRFTAAIAEKDKQKANDFSHAQAYLGAAAVFDQQGKSEMALDHYHKGSRLLHKLPLHQSSFLLAGSYMRIALLYKDKGRVYYPQAIEFFQKALAIYKLDETHKAYTSAVHRELKELHLHMGQEKVSKYHSRLEEEICSPQKVGLQKQEGFFQEFFTVKREESSARSSNATEPSPVQAREQSPRLPPIKHQEIATSPMRSQHDQGCSPHVKMQPSRHPVSSQDIGCSPLRIPHPPVSEGLTQLIERAKIYSSRKAEKVRAVNELRGKLDTYGKGLLTKEEVLEYINRELSIPDNLIFSGVFTENVEKMFREAKHRLEG